MKNFVRALTGSPAIFGSVDGLTIVVGLVAGLVLSHQAPSALWHAALSGGLAELVGMTSGQRQSDPEGGWPSAVACGLMSALACILPAFPFLFLSGLSASIASVIAIACVCAFITWLRPEKGWKAVTQTYGLTIAAGILCAAFALV